MKVDVLIGHFPAKLPFHSASFKPEMNGDREMLPGAVIYVRMCVRAFNG